MVRGHIRCRTNLYTEKKEIWVPLSRRAQIPHSTRTKVHGSAPLHHTTNLHYTTCLYLLLQYYGEKDAVCFKSRMFCFSCSAVLLPETYGIPYHLVHIMPPCKEEGKDDAKLASSILYTLLELAPRTIYVLVTVLEKQQRKKNCSARCIACGARLACFICRQTPKTTETLHYLLQVWPACPARLPACLLVLYVL